MLVLAARVCPPGVEGTLYALLMSVLNLGSILSKALGSLLMLALHVTDSDFSLLWLLVLLCSASSLLPLLLMPKLVPDLRAKGAPALVDSGPPAAAPVPAVPAVPAAGDAHAAAPSAV